MEFPPPSGFLEGDFKDTRARGQESCCLTFCSETSFQEVLDREKPTHSCSACSGEQIPRAGSDHWGAVGALTPRGCVGCEEGAGSSSGASRPWHRCSQLLLLDVRQGTNPTSSRIFWGVHRGLGAVKGRCGRGDEEMSEGRGPAQGGDGSAGFG